MKRSIIVAVLCTLFVPPLLGESTTQMKLASIQRVEVKPVMGAMGFDPIPGFPRGSLDEKITKAALSALKEHNLSPGGSDSPRLYIFVDHDLGSCGQVALNVRVELSERAAVHRELPEGVDAKQYASTWVDDSLDLVSVEEVEASILESVEYLVGKFAGKASQARAYVRSVRVKE